MNVAGNKHAGETCTVCGIEFYNDWEALKHLMGKHLYRAWRPEDGEKKFYESRSRSAREPRP